MSSAATSNPATVAATRPQPARPQTARGHPSAAAAASHPAVPALAISSAQSGAMTARVAAPTGTPPDTARTAPPTGRSAAPPSIVENPEGGQTIDKTIIPDTKTLLYAAKIATEKDKPILLDYYVDSIQGNAYLGVSKETPTENILIKNRQEFTSPIVKKQMVGNPQVRADIIVETENSIYIVSSKIQKASY